MHYNFLGTNGQSILWIQLQSSYQYGDGLDITNQTSLVCMTIRHCSSLFAIASMLVEQGNKKTKKIEIITIDMMYQNQTSNRGSYTVYEPILECKCHPYNTEMHLCDVPHALQYWILMVIVCIFYCYCKLITYFYLCKVSFASSSTHTYIHT